MPLSTPEIELESYFDALLHEPNDRSSASSLRQIQSPSKRLPENSTASAGASSQTGLNGAGAECGSDKRETTCFEEKTSPDARPEETRYSAKQKRFLRRLELAQMGRAFSRSSAVKRQPDASSGQNTRAPSQPPGSALSCRLFRYFDRRIAIPLKDIVSVTPLESSQVRQLVGRRWFNEIEESSSENGDLQGEEAVSRADGLRPQAATPEARAKTIEELHALLDDVDLAAANKPAFESTGATAFQLINGKAFEARYTGAENSVLVRVGGRSGQDLGILMTAALAKSRLQLQWFGLSADQDQDHGLGPELGSGVVGVMRLSGKDTERLVESRLLLFDAGQFFRAQYAKKVLAPDAQE